MTRLVERSRAISSDLPISAMWPVAGGRSLAFGPRPLVMGIVNVTPDSFSDGGLHFERRAAVEAALRMLEERADIIDIGGESTRPGAEPVDASEELERVIPVIEEVVRRSDAVISVDTMKAAVAREALRAGASIVNDVTSLRHDPEMAGIVRQSGAGVILMHMRGTPKTMQEDIRFGNLMAEVSSELGEGVDLALAGGIERASILIDPGIGFGKTFEQNLEILARCHELRAVAPVVIGASRKGFIGQLTGQPGGAPRMAGSLAALAAAARRGVAVVRVHDVKASVDFLRVFLAIEGSGA
jgi:dihydropteroate synthase